MIKNINTILCKYHHEVMLIIYPEVIKVVIMGGNQITEYLTKNLTPNFRLTSKGNNSQEQL